MKILITCPPMLRRIDDFKSIFDQKGIDLLTPNVVQTLTEEELMELVPKAEGWIIGDDPATKRVFKAGTEGKLRAAVKWGVGVDNVDFEACKALGIPIANTPQMFGEEVADIAIGYLVGLARDTYRVHQGVRNNQWIKPAGMSISGKNVAVIGLGDIGRAVIKRLKGFDAEIIGYDPFNAKTSEELGIKAVYAFPHEIHKADFVILTAALTASSRYMINESTIGLMKDGVYLINVARGPLIKQADLISALRTGKVRGAALDVFEVEPLPEDSELRKFDQCIFGSHNGSNTIEAVQRASLKAIDLIFNFLHV